MKNVRIAATKTVGVMVAATAASLMVTAGPAYASAGFSPAPMRHHHHHDNGDNNSSQSPTQICGNNVANNIGIGSFGHGKAKGGNNKSSCKQKTTSR